MPSKSEEFCGPSSQKKKNRIYVHRAMISLQLEPLRLPCSKTNKTKQRKRCSCPDLSSPGLNQPPGPFPNHFRPIHCWARPWNVLYFQGSAQLPRSPSFQLLQLSGMFFQVSTALCAELSPGSAVVHCVSTPLLLTAGEAGTRVSPVFASWHPGNS